MAIYSVHWEVLYMSLHSSGPSLGEVFVANRAQLLRVAHKIVRTMDLADDIVQDAYLRIVGGASERKIDQPIGYCCQVVRNLALDHCRRQAVERNCVASGMDVEALEVAGPGSPDRLMRDRQLVGLIEKALADLPTRTRVAFQLYRLDGMTQRDIAISLGCALGLVNRLIAEATQAIAALHHLLTDD